MLKTFNSTITLQVGFLKHLGDVQITDYRLNQITPLPEGTSRTVQHPTGTGVGALEALRDRGTGQTASRAAPVPGPTVEQGAREAMADLETREAMADLLPRPRPQPPPGLYGWSHTPPPQKKILGGAYGA